MSVRRARAEITPEEFDWWRAYYQIEPFGEERADMRNAMLCCLYANSKRGKHGRKFRLQDFMFSEKPRRQTPEQMKQVFMSFAKTQNRMVRQRQQKKKREQEKKADGNDSDTLGKPDSSGD